MMFLSVPVEPVSIHSLSISQKEGVSRSTFRVTKDPMDVIDNSNIYFRRVRARPNRCVSHTITHLLTFRFSVRKNSNQEDMYLSLCWSMVKSCIQHRSQPSRIGNKIPTLFQ